MSKKRSLEALNSDGPVTGNNTKNKVFISSSIKDRASTFTAVFSPDVPGKTLQSREDFRSASHRILGWRKSSTQQSLAFSDSKSKGKELFTTGSDDDGEKYAGKKLEKVLTELNATGAVVVARWYGGVLLGPVRFTHIENVAKEAISKYQTEQHPEIPSKRMKADTGPASDTTEDERKRESLVRELQRRDDSIATLRGLLQSLQGNEATSEPSSNTSDISKAKAASPVAKPHYSSMPLQKLQQLDKARDATIAWLLKQIDTAEQKTKDSLG